MPNPLTTHPVTSRIFGSGIAVTIVVYLAGRFGVNLSAEDAAIVVTVASTVLAFIGSDGLVGAWRILMHGTKHPK
jgi:hypothetical protein